MQAQINKLIAITQTQLEVSKQHTPDPAVHTPDPTIITQLTSRLEAAETQVVALTTQLGLLKLQQNLKNAGKILAPTLTESSLQAKLGIRDEIILKKVDAKILAAVTQYEQKVQAQTQP